MTKTQQISLKNVTDRQIAKASGLLPERLVDKMPSFEHCHNKTAKAWKAQILGYLEIHGSGSPTIQIDYKCENGCKFQVITYLNGQHYNKLFETHITGNLNSEGEYQIWFAGSFPIWTLTYDRLTEWDAGVDASRRRKQFLQEFDQLLTSYILEVGNND